MRTINPNTKDEIAEYFDVLYDRVYKNRTKAEEQRQRVFNFLWESKLPFVEAQAVEAEQDLIGYEAEMGEEMTFDAFVQRFKTRNNIR